MSFLNPLMTGRSAANLKASKLSYSLLIISYSLFPNYLGCLSSPFGGGICSLPPGPSPCLPPGRGPCLPGAILLNTSCMISSNFFCWSALHIALNCWKCLNVSSSNCRSASVVLLLPASINESGALGCCNKEKKSSLALRMLSRKGLWAAWWPSLSLP